MEKITRSYVKRDSDKAVWAGEIGKVELGVPSMEGWMLDGKPLPTQSVAYLCNFALQAFQDAYAGAKDLGEAQANFAKKLKSVVDGTMGMKGEAADETTTAQRFVVLKQLVLKAKAAGGVAPKYTNEQLDAIFAKNAEKLADMVKDRIASLATARAAAAKLAAVSMELEL